MKNKLTCLTLWAALAATYVQADTVVQPIPEKNWSASISADFGMNNHSVVQRLKSATPEVRWSKTSLSNRTLSGGATLQGTTDLFKSPYYTGAEFSYTFGNHKTRSHQYRTTTRMRSTDNDRSMSNMCHAGVLLGRRFTNFNAHIKAGYASARVKHISHFATGGKYDLAYKQTLSGIVLGFGLTTNIQYNLDLGLDFEHKFYSKENHSGYISGGAPYLLYQKANAKIDTLKLRLIYKI